MHSSTLVRRKTMLQPATEHKHKQQKRSSSTTTTAAIQNTKSAEDRLGRLGRRKGTAGGGNMIFASAFRVHGLLLSTFLVVLLAQFPSGRRLSHSPLYDPAMPHEIGEL
uniref:Transmembrane protein n=1 Tax=Anopheles farauti TaxID=69004 RepID=A0A182QR53_9DIPT